MMSELTELKQELESLNEQYRTLSNQYSFLLADKRDQFAMAALTGYVANPSFDNTASSDKAEWSYEDADAILEAREKKDE